MRALGVVVLVVVPMFGACGGHARTTQARAPATPKLPAPLPVDPNARGAAYLAAVAAAVQPPWGQFLEDCRLRLPASHPLNTAALSATADLAVDRRGHLVDVRIVTSGNADFDLAVREILAEIPQLAMPPVDLVSDDDQAHLRWLFARDRRQAGPATAQLLTVTLPVISVTERLLAEGDLERAAVRVAAAPVSDPDRVIAVEHVMVAALREALATGGSARVAAVEAIGRARVFALAPDVRALVASTVGEALRVRAIEAVAALGDDASAPTLLAQLPLDLPAHGDLAIAETSALVALGHRDEAASAIRAILEDRDALENVALEAHALAPSATLKPSLAARFARSQADPALRAAVCSAIAAEHPDVALIGRGLRDADARVRAACVDAMVRVLQPLADARRARASTDAPRLVPADLAALRRLGDLVKDRDAAVRARAVRASGRLASLLGPSRGVHAVADPAPEVRIAAAPTATDAEQRALAADPDPEVRAAAISVIADRDTTIALRAARDPAAQVRRAAAGSLVDEDVLQELARDPAPEVATAALVRLTRRRGRAVMTAPLLTQLAAAPAGSVDRVRIALAWLLGP